MRSEQRKSARKRLHYPAGLETGDGSAVHECLVWDISGTGAKITLQMPAELPDQVTLLLSRCGSARRLCRIVWRTDLQIGVEFVPEDRKASAAARKPATGENGAG